ncbi:hypothetical protein GY45DRAFT_547856 [Cubamyces sp. BRFM 1775]|nr:hypothetical protein GY45DRAFT_547856 [Cubamyces sp. BRFM 1775]
MSRTPSSSRPPPTKSSSTADFNGKNAAARDDVIRTKILLLGMRRSGKTSIRQVLFNNLSPRETLYLETTTHLTKQPFDTIIPLEIWDCPGDVPLETIEAHLAEFAAMIFVIDIQDMYQQPIQKLVDLVKAAYEKNQAMNLEVFVHKADVLTEEYKIENFRHIQQRVLSDLAYYNVEFEQIPLNFQLTSIYDHSLHDAFSRVLHKLIDSLPYLEDLLNVFCANSQATKAFLFDTASRLYVATDASPVDPPTHNLCSDYLQTLNAFGPLYKSVSASPLRMHPGPPEASAPPASTPATTSTPASPRPPAATAASTSGIASGPASRLASPRPTSPSALPSTQTSPRANGAVLPAPITASPSPMSTPALPSSTTTPSASSASSTTAVPTTSSAPSTPSATLTARPPPAASRTPSHSHSHTNPTSPLPQPQPRFYPSAAASLSPTAAGAAGTTLTYHLITPQLALLALLPSGVFAARRGLVEYNVVFFREGVQEICAVEADARALP